MDAAANQKIDREELFKYIKARIESSENGEYEVSTSEVARAFHVSPASIDFHLKKFLKSGELATAERRGKQNKKIYRLPSLEVTSPVKMVYDPENPSALVSKILQHATPKQGIVPNIATPSGTRDEDPEEDVKVQLVADARESTDILLFEDLIEEREKSLDDQIREFESRTKASSAETMLEKDDREILAVAVESMQQFHLYFKDLMDQMSTLEDKKFIMSLIEERNENMKLIESLQDENKALNAKVDELVGQRPDAQEREDRAKNMYQQILYTIDNFVEQPSHAMYLDRLQFRKDLNKEVSHLFKFSLDKE